MLTEERERRLLVRVLIAAFLIPFISSWFGQFEALEGDVLAVALKPIPDILTDNWPDQSPLFFVLLHLWTRLVGVEEVGVRLLNVILAVPSVYFTYRIGKLIFTPRVALLAAGTLVISPGFYDHVRHARMYSLLMAACSAAVFFSLRYVKEKKPVDLLYYGLASVIAVYTHYFGIGAAGLCGAYIFLTILATDRKRLPQVILAGILTLAASAHNIHRLVTEVDPKAPNVGVYSLKANFPRFFAEAHHFVFMHGIDFRAGGVNYGWVDTILWVFTLAVVVYGMILAGRRHAFFAFLYIFVSQAALFVAATRQDVRPRYFAFMVPVFVVYSIAAVERLVFWPGGGRARKVGAAAGLILLTCCVIGVGAQYNRKTPGYKESAAFIQSVFQPGDLIATHPNWHQPIMQLRIPQLVLPAADWTVLREVSVNYKRVILTLGTDEKNDPPRMLAWLQTNGSLLENRSFGSTRVQVWALDAGTTPVMRQLQARMAAAAPGDLQLLLAGGIASGATPPETVTSVHEALRGRVPLVTFLDATSAPAKQLETALSLGVDAFAVPGTPAVQFRYQDEPGFLRWPSPSDLVGAPLALHAATPVSLLPVDLSTLEGDLAKGLSLPAKVSAALAAAKTGGEVVVLVRWPKALHKGHSEPLKSLGRALVAAGALAVVGVERSVTSQPWQEGNALVATGLGTLARAARGTGPALEVPEGYVVHLWKHADGRLDCALLGMGTTKQGLIGLGMLRELKPVADPLASPQYDFRAHLPEAQVRLPGEAGRSVEPVSRFSSARALLFFRWGSSDYSGVGQGIERSDGELREGIWAPLPASRKLELVFPAVPLAEELRGFLGLAEDGFKAGKAKIPLRLEVLVGQELVGQSRGGLEPAWKGFRFDTRKFAGQTLPVTLRLEGEASLPVLMNLTTLKLVSQTPLAAGETLVRRLEPELAARVAAIRAEDLKAAETRPRRPVNVAAMSTRGQVVTIGELTYKLAKGVPKQAGRGLLADPRWASAAVPEREYPPLPPTPEGAWRLRDHLEEAVVTRQFYDGGWELCSAWSTWPTYLKGEEFGPQGEGRLEARWRCGQEKWKTVARTRQKSGGVLRDALWIHPRDNGIMTVTWPEVPLTDRLTGYYGVTDVGVDKNDFAIRVEVWVGGRLVRQAVVPPDLQGWQEFAVDTSPWKGTKTEVMVRVESDKQRWRHFCLDAMTLP